MSTSQDLEVKLNIKLLDAECNSESLTKRTGGILAKSKLFQTLVTKPISCLQMGLMWTSEGTSTIPWAGRGESVVPSGPWVPVEPSKEAWWI